MTDGLRKSHLRKAPPVGLFEGGLPEGNQFALLSSRPPPISHNCSAKSVFFAAIPCNGWQWNSHENFFQDTISARPSEMEECLENKAKCVFYGGNLRK